MYITRDIEAKIKSSVRSFPSVAVTGPRQSGKSTLLKKMFHKSHQYISFDDPVVRERAISDPKLFFDQAGQKVILDEIQYVPQLTSYIKMAIDEHRNVNGRFLITGSQQFQLIKHLGDSLAGRVALFELLPFDYHEKSRLLDAADAGKMFTHSCLRSSYPQPAIDPHLDFSQWCSSYFQTYLERDIRSLYDIGSLRDFQRFMQLLAARCSQILNLSTFANDLGVSVNTIKKWVSILEASRIIYLLYPYYQNLGKRIVKSPKVYFIDCGLICYLTGIKDKNALMNGPLAGALFENYCVQETLKQILNSRKNIGVYYLRTHNNLEVDLIIESNMVLYPCEIKLSKTINTHMASSIERFKDLFKKFKVGQGRILSLSDEKFALTQNVFVSTLSDYLNWLSKEL